MQKGPEKPKPSRIWSFTQHRRPLEPRLHSEHFGCNRTVTQDAVSPRGRLPVRFAFPKSCTESQMRRRPVRQVTIRTRQRHLNRSGKACLPGGDGAAGGSGEGHPSPREQGLEERPAGQHAPALHATRTTESAFPSPGTVRGQDSGYSPAVMTSQSAYVKTQQVHSEQNEN